MEACMAKLRTTTVALRTPPPPFHGTLHLEEEMVRHRVETPASVQLGPWALLSLALARPTACRFEYAVLLCIRLSVRDKHQEKMRSRPVWTKHVGR